MIEEIIRFLVLFHLNITTSSTAAARLRVYQDNILYGSGVFLTKKLLVLEFPDRIRLQMQ